MVATILVAAALVLFVFAFLGAAPTAVRECALGGGALAVAFLVRRG